MRSPQVAHLDEGGWPPYHWSRLCGTRPIGGRAKQAQTLASEGGDMATGPNAQAGAGTAQTPERIYVKIPKAGPGQRYQAPKNYRQPLLMLVSRLLVVLLCLSLPIIPLVIIGLILFLPGSHGATNAYEEGFLWLWIPMFLFVELIAISVAIGVGREALGVAGNGPFER
jgi:hypothetical protein